MSKGCIKFSPDFIFSPEAEARIRRGELTREKVQEATDLLFSVTRAFRSGTDVEQFKAEWKKYIAMGADVNYVVPHSDQNKPPEDFMTAVIRCEWQRPYGHNLDLLRMAIDLGAVAQAKTYPLKDDLNVGLKRPDLLTPLLLDIGGIMVMPTSPRENDTLYVFYPDGSHLSIMGTNANSKDSHTCASLDFDLLRQMKATGDAAAQKLLSAKDEVQPFAAAALSFDETKSLLMAGWLLDHDILDILSKDPVGYNYIATKFPIFSPMLPNLHREHAAAYARTTVHGPAAEWDVGIRDLGIMDRGAAR